LIDQKLMPDAPIYILGCEQFIPWTAAGTELLADRTDHPVICNQGNCTLSTPWYGGIRGTAKVLVTCSPKVDP
jgi:hypothetical protein